MATTTFTLKPSPVLPVGATVAAYPVSNWPNGIPDTGAAPLGSATNSQTMGSTGLTFTGLTAGTRYVAYTLVGSEYHYVGFTVGDESELGGGDTQHTPTGAAGGDLAGTYPNPTLGAGLAREAAASSTTSELLATPQAAVNNGFVVKGITGWDGTQAYGKAQAFMLLRDDNSGGDNLYSTTATAPDKDVLTRIDGRTGAFGTSGGAHFALGLRQHTGFTGSQNVWIQNYLDAIGLVISSATGGTADFYRFQTFTGTVKARMDVNGNLSLGAASPVAKISLPADTVAAGGIDFGGGEIQLYRAAANALQVDNATVGFKANSNTALQTAQTASVGVLSNRLLSSDAQAALKINGDGKIEWGVGGSTARDLSLKRSGVGVLAVRNQADSADADLTVGALTASGTSSLQATTINGLTITNASNIVLATGTGTKIGTGATQKLGFWNTTPVARAAAYTQTYATATRTHSNPVGVALTDNSGGTANTTLQAISASPLQAEVANNFADLALAVNNNITDIANVKQVLNQVIDDLQLYGLLA